MRVRNLILIGHKNCGKSYWGKKLAHALECPFIDTDQIIEDMYGKNQKCSEIYASIGESGFREIEHIAVHALKKTVGGVVAVGGGAPLYPKNLMLLDQMGPLIYLKVDKEVLKARTLTKTLPAFFSKKDPELSFESFYHKRTTLYETISTHSIYVSAMQEDLVLMRLKEIANGK